MNGNYKVMLNLQQKASEMQELIEMQIKEMQVQRKLLISYQGLIIPYLELATDTYNRRNIKTFVGRYLKVLTKLCACCRNYLD